MKLSNVQLLHHFGIFLGSGLVCKCLGNCLCILEDKVVKTAVASYLVWFERRSKIDQDNIILQWMIYGHTPGGRHSATTSQHRRREFGYHVPMNPYKVVEMWKNYRPLVPVEYQCDILYAEPDPEVMAKVKDKKVYRAESRVGLKGIKYGTAKDTIEDMAFGDGGVSGSI